MGVAFAVAVAVVVALLVRWRRAGFGIVERLARRASPLMLAWLVPVLFDRRLWIDRDVLAMPLVLASGWGVRASLLTSWDTAPAFPRLGVAWGRVARSRPARACAAVVGMRATPLVVVAAASLAYAVYFSVLSVENHWNLNTSAFDLALEENLVWHVVHGGLTAFQSTPFSGPTGTHFGNHATFFAYFIAPIYWLAPHPETLLVLQATLLGGAAVPLYLYASRHVPAWIAAFVALAYLVYPPLHGANLYDFHYLPLGVVFLWLTLYAVEARQRVLAALAVVLALSVREDVAACLAVVGSFLLVTGAAARAGAAIAAVGGGYFLVMKGLVMGRAGSGGPSFLDQYAGLLPKGESTFGGVVKTLVTNPLFAADVIVQREKVIYVLQILTPLLFLPLTRPIGILLVVPGLVFTLLSTGYAPLYEPSFQYTTYWTAFVFIGLVAALAHVARERSGPEPRGARRLYALVAGTAAATLSCTALDGAILHRDGVLSGFSRVDLRMTNESRQKHQDLAALVLQIPADARVVASEHLLPHVASRADAYRMAQQEYDADWLLYGEPLDAREVQTARSCLDEGTFGVVEVRGTLVLARRGAPAERNAEVLERLEE